MKMSKTNYVIFAIVMICVALLVFLITKKDGNNGSVEPTPTANSEQEQNSNYADRISLSATSLNIPVGGTGEFEITLKNAVGRIDVTSSDETIATVDKSNVWLESITDDELDTKAITITGVSAGTCQINIDLVDVASFDTEEEMKGTYTINVTVE